MIVVETPPNDDILLLKRCVNFSESLQEDSINLTFSIKLETNFSFSVQSENGCGNSRTSLLQRCVQFYESLKKEAFKVSCLMRLKSKFTFLLQSRNESPKTKKYRSSSYLARQKRKEAFLAKKKAGSSFDVVSDSVHNAVPTC